MLVEVLSGLKRKATFIIKKDDVDSRVQEEVKKYAKTAKIQGFRPGKVPYKILEQIYGGKAFEDVLNDLISKSFTTAVVDNKFHLAGSPKFDLVNSENGVFTFVATFEIMPEIKIGDLSKQEIEKPVCSLSDEQIEKIITVLRKQKANYILENKIAENEDKVEIDFIGKVDDVPFEGGSAENYSFVLGQKSMLPDFEAGILGLKAGESADVKVNFPENYHAENLKGKTAIFNIVVKNIFKAEMPELNEDFIKSAGVADGSIESFKKEIRESVNREMTRRINSKYRENILKALSDSSPMDIPYNLVHDEIHHMMDTTKENMLKQGYKEEQIKLTHEMFENDAKRIVTLRLLIQQIIKDNNVTVSDNEIKAVIEEMALVYEDPAEYIKWYYQDANRVNNAKAIAMEKKVIDLIANQAKIKEVSIDYDSLMK